MKIVFNTDQIYLHGGIEKVMATKANYWAKIPGVQVYIVTTEQEGKIPCYTLDKKISLVDLSINYNRSKSYFSIENLIKAVIHLRKQIIILRKLKPDFLISPNYNFDHYWLPFIKGKSKILKERHGSRYKEVLERSDKSLRKRLSFKFNDWLDSRYDNIIVLNEDEKSYVKSGNAIVIPNPIEPQIFQSNGSNKKVIAAGRISPVKGFDHLIKAWAIVHKANPSWVLDIFGQNYLDTTEKLRVLIGELHLQDAIFIKESVDDLPKIMSGYSIYALSSETECFPMVLLEALSVGLPIVSYDCPNGPRHIVTNNEDGILVQQNRIDDLAAALDSLINNWELRTRMAENAKQNSQKFLPSVIMKHWQTLLNLPDV